MTDPHGRGPLIAVVGGGQLGRMLGLAGLPMGLRFRFLDPALDPPAAAVGEVIRAAYDDPGALDALCADAQVVTYEFENVPMAAAARLAARAAVHPPPPALAMAQDRLGEKRAFGELGVDTAPYRAVDTRDDLVEAAEALGLPAVLKTRRMGYDGKGQVVLGSSAELDPAWDRLGGRPLILEAFVPFSRELSILAVRGREGETRFYPLVENEHEDGILVRSTAPASGVEPALQARAEEIGTTVLDALRYVGVLAVELFQVGDRLLANEMAPRVHNSGHWTQDGAWTSQFENHLRAILGLPLGPTGLRGEGAAMVNVLGSPPALEALARIPGARLHLYDKEPRPGRKIGHVNVVAGPGLGGSLEERTARVREAVHAAQRSQRP